MRLAFDSLTDCSCVLRVSDSVFCNKVSCCANASIWVFCVRVASALCCTRVCWKVAKVFASSSRPLRALSPISRRNSRSSLSWPAAMFVSNSVRLVSEGCSGLRSNSQASNSRLATARAMISQVSIM